MVAICEYADLRRLVRAHGYLAARNIKIAIIDSAACDSSIWIIVWRNSEAMAWNISWGGGLPVDFLRDRDSPISSRVDLPLYDYPFGIGGQYCISVVSASFIELKYVVLWHPLASAA